MTSRLSGRTLGHVDPFEGFLSDARGLRTHFGRCEMGKFLTLHEKLQMLLGIIPPNEEIPLRQRLTTIRDSIPTTPEWMHTYWHKVAETALDMCLTPRIRSGDRSSWLLDAHEFWIFHNTRRI